MERRRQRRRMELIRWEWLVRLLILVMICEEQTKAGARALSCDYLVVSRSKLSRGHRRLVERGHVALANNIILAKSLDDEEVRELEQDDSIEWIERDIQINADELQFVGKRLWSLDRIDQRNAELDGRFEYDQDQQGEGSVIYIVDSGIRASHVDIRGRVLPGKSFIEALDGNSNMLRPDQDCFGHGTHIASTVAGKEYGIAKKASLVPVRIFDCSGRGQLSWLIQALLWSIDDASQQGWRQKIINLSLSTSLSLTLDAVVGSAIQQGFVVVTSAGNSNRDACDYSPGRLTDLINVASVGRGDVRSTFSNHGSCVDLFAPGEDIVAASHVSDHETTKKSGTSMAAPLVSGAVAALWSKHWNSTAKEIQGMLLARATHQVVQDACYGSTHIILFAGRDVLATQIQEDEERNVIVVTDEPKYKSSKKSNAFYDWWVYSGSIQQDMGSMTTEKPDSDKYAVCYTANVRLIKGRKSDASVYVGLRSLGDAGVSHAPLLMNQSSRCATPDTGQYFVAKFTPKNMQLFQNGNNRITKVSKNARIRFSKHNSKAIWVAVRPTLNANRFQIEIGKVVGEPIIEFEYESTAGHVLNAVSFQSGSKVSMRFTDIQAC